MKKMKRYSLAELKKMSSQTDIQRVKNMKDKDIDYSDSPDVSELVVANVLRPVGRPCKANPKRAVNIRLDQEVLDGFKKTGRNWQTLINDTLREWLQWRSLL